MIFLPPVFFHWFDSDQGKQVFETERGLAETGQPLRAVGSESSQFGQFGWEFFLDLTRLLDSDPVPQLEDQSFVRPASQRPGIGHFRVGPVDHDDHIDQLAVLSERLISFDTLFHFPELCDRLARCWEVLSQSCVQFSAESQPKTDKVNTGMKWNECNESRPPEYGELAGTCVAAVILYVAMPEALRRKCQLLSVLFSVHFKNSSHSSESGGRCERTNPFTRTQQISANVKTRKTSQDLQVAVSRFQVSKMFAKLLRPFIN